MEKNKLDTTNLLLSQGDIDGAIASLIDYLSVHENKNLYKNATLLQTRWASIKTQNLQGVISTQDYQLSFNKIALDIKDLILDSQSKYLRKEPSEKKSYIRIFIVLLLITSFVLLLYIYFKEKIVVTRPSYRFQELRNAAITSYDCYVYVINTNVAKIDADSLLFLKLERDDLKKISNMTDDEIEKSQSYYERLINNAQTICNSK